MSMAEIFTENETLDQAIATWEARREMYMTIIRMLETHEGEFIMKFYTDQVELIDKMLTDLKNIKRNQEEK